MSLKISYFPEKNSNIRSTQQAARAHIYPIKLLVWINKDPIYAPQNKRKNTHAYTIGRGKMAISNGTGVKG